MIEIYHTSSFLRDFQKVPLEIQEHAAIKTEIFKKNPRDPRLKTHKLHGELRGNLAFTVTGKIRIMFYFENPTTAVFVKIGDHDIYD